MAGRASIPWPFAVLYVQCAVSRLLPLFSVCVVCVSSLNMVLFISVSAIRV